MHLHGIALRGRQVLAYHDHNGAEMRPKLLARLQDGQSIAYASEAGTPLVADPGYALARDAIAAGHNVTTAPGPSALTAALCVAGLPTDRVFFAGFPPAAAGARRKWIAVIGAVQATLVIYEAPSRVQRTLTELCEGLGSDRAVALCRELTKRFEEVRRGTLAELADDPGTLKGEMVLVIDRDRSEPDATDMESALLQALETLSVKDAAAQVALALGLPRRQVYQAALALETKK